MRSARAGSQRSLYQRSRYVLSEGPRSLGSTCHRAILSNVTLDAGSTLVSQDTVTHSHGRRSSHSHRFVLARPPLSEDPKVTDTHRHNDQSPEASAASCQRTSIHIADNTSKFGGFVNGRGVLRDVYSAIHCIAKRIQRCCPVWHQVVWISAIHMYPSGCPDPKGEKC